MKNGSKIKKVSDTRIDIKQYIRLKEQGKEGAKSFKTLEETLKKNKININNLAKESERLDRQLEKFKKTKDINIKVEGAKAELKGLSDELFKFKKTYAAIIGSVYINADVKQAQGELATLGNPSPAS